MRGGVDLGSGTGVGSSCHRGLGVGVSAQWLSDGARVDGDVGCCYGGCGLVSGDLGWTGMAARDRGRLSPIIASLEDYSCLQAGLNSFARFVSSQNGSPGVVAGGWCHL